MVNFPEKHSSIFRQVMNHFPKEMTIFREVIVHFPEVMVNDLTSDVHDTEAMCPEYKVVSVSIRKARKVVSRV